MSITTNCLAKVMALAPTDYLIPRNNLIPMFC